MSALANFSVKQKDGSYKNYTISINDTIDAYGNNVVVYESQTKEQRLNKEKKTYLGNGTVTWTDGNIVVAPKKEKKSTTVNANEDLDDSSLPF
jgi:hypothetical protein